MRVGTAMIAWTGIAAVFASGLGLAAFLLFG